MTQEVNNNIKNENFKIDSKQLIVQNKLVTIQNYLEKKTFSKFIKKVCFIKEKPCHGLYIYGDVGRGKSMLLKKFYNSLQKTPKLYCHFNSFMKSVHEAFRDVRKEKTKYNDQLIESINRVINTDSLFYKRMIEDYDDEDYQNILYHKKYNKNKTIKVLCLDEFQVMDSADSIILSRILTYLIKQKIIVIFTSNCHPLDLYKNGIQADLFNDFVKDVLLPNCPAIKIKSDKDYREIKSNNKSTTRFFISQQSYDTTLSQIINQITKNKIKQKSYIKVWGREIVVDNSYPLNDNDIKFLNLDKEKNNKSVEKNGNNNKKFAVFTFKELCCSNYSTADYQAICHNFELIFLIKIPHLKKEDTNEARRLTLFIDEIYENKNSLIILSAKEPEEIYAQGTGSKTFLRTVSRLKEIQSDEYWQNSKLYQFPSKKTYKN